MVSSKDVTFARSEARNIGELWNGQSVVVMEGTALDAVTEMSVIGKPANFNNIDEVFTFRGSLKAGTLSVREKYSGNIVASDVAIPSNGTYHVMYNKSTGRFRIYSQDIMTHLGKNTPMNNGTGTSYYPEDFTLNQFIDNTYSPLALSDYYGNATGVSISLDATAVSGTGTFNYSYDNVCGNSGTRPNYSPWVNDDFYPNYGWGRAWSFSNTDKTSNSGDILFTISGLDNSAVYDVRVLGTRYNSSTNIRCASFAIGSDEIIVDNATPSAGTYSLAEFKNRIANFDGVSPSSSNIVIKMHTITKHRDAQNDDFSEGYINFIYLSKVVYSQN